MLFGDSITQKAHSAQGGWASLLADAYQRRVDVINRGYSGYNTRLAMEVFPRLVEPIQNVQLLTVFFGANDAALPHRTSSYQHVPIDEYESRLIEIVHGAKKMGVRHIVLITPPPVSEPHRIQHALTTFGIQLEASERENTFTKKYVDACVHVGEKLAIPVLNLWEIFMKQEAWAERLLNDGLHLTEEGNSVVYTNLQDLINACFPHLNHEVMAFDTPDFRSLLEDKESDPVSKLRHHFDLISPP